MLNYPVVLKTLTIYHKKEPYYNVWSSSSEAFGLMLKNCEEINLANCSLGSDYGRVRLTDNFAVKRLKLDKCMIKCRFMGQNKLQLTHI